MSRYPAMFAALKERGEGAFVPFVMVGDPDPDTSEAVIEALIAGGADALELGVPFTDPVADGPTIQRAHIRALEAGTGFADALGVPAYGVCSLDAIAAAADRRGTIVVVTDARRREVYWARYTDGARVAGPEVCKPADLPVDAVDVLSVPDNIEVAVDAAESTYRAPQPAGLVAVARLDQAPEPLVPLYLRRPDAVPPKQAPKSPALP